MSNDLKPTVIVIFGITGDLSQRKLLPALYHLMSQGLLHPDTQIIGITRQAITADAIIDQTKLCVLATDKVCDTVALQTFHDHLRIFQMDLTQQSEYKRLKTELDTLESSLGTCLNRLFYLSVPPQVLGQITDSLGQSNLHQSCEHNEAFSHLLVEKPFGCDLASAEDLIARTNKYFNEDQIFRIDHYLAKETAQNILTFRFHNPIFESLWNNKHVKDITITAEEKIDIEGRTTFYEQTGALRDLIQSHLLQLLAIVTMEKPSSETSEAVHAKKLELLQAVEPIPTDKLHERAIRGQYDGYTDEVHNPTSTTETYAALELYIGNERWNGVPVYIKTGKAMAEKQTAITLQFAEDDTDENANTLTFAIQPNEAIGIDLWVKRPGFDNRIETAAMDFAYHRTFENDAHPDAYERVLVDALRGDHTLFATSDEVLASWKIIQPVIDRWTTDGDGLRAYPKGASTI